MSGKKLELEGEEVASFPCTCGGDVRVVETTQAPPGCLPIVVSHTLPMCASFEQNEPAVFIRKLHLARFPDQPSRLRN